MAFEKHVILQSAMRFHRYIPQFFHSGHDDGISGGKRMERDTASGYSNDSVDSDNSKIRVYKSDEKKLLHHSAYNDRRLGRLSPPVETKSTDYGPLCREEQEIQHI